MSTSTMKKIPLLALVLLCATSLAAQHPLRLDDKLSDTIAAALKNSGAPSVSIAVVYRGKLTYAKAFGSADIAAGRAADVNTRCRRLHQ